EGQPMSPYQAMERELPEEHPIDATVERRVPQRKLRRRMRDAGERLMQGLGERRGLWMRLEELLGLYHSRREETYFNLGYDHDVAAGRVEGLRALDDHQTSSDARSLADQLRELAIQADVSRTEKVAALLEAAWALALDLSPNRTNHNRRTR
ncbi:MAG: hypothetical protein P1P87_17700, partial [Trueperaceae bacterium]|nr:hypothetical protein [Trueperaceae bacterium]